MNKSDLVQRVRASAQLEPEQAERLTDTVLATLCGRLTLGEVRHLASRVQGLENACSLQRPNETQQDFELEQFIFNIRDECDVDDSTATRATVATFRELKRALPEEEIGEVADQLPDKLRVIWLQS